MNTKCKYKSEQCGQCEDIDPFTTQNYCPVAVKVFLANENIPCPMCKKEYLKLNTEHSFECPACNHKIDYEKIL